MRKLLRNLPNFELGDLNQWISIDDVTAFPSICFSIYISDGTRNPLVALQRQSRQYVLYMYIYRISHLRVIFSYWVTLYRKSISNKHLTGFYIFFRCLALYFFFWKFYHISKKDIQYSCEKLFSSLFMFYLILYEIGYIYLILIYRSYFV